MNMFFLYHGGLIQKFTLNSHLVGTNRDILLMPLWNSFSLTEVRIVGHKLSLGEGIW